MSDLREPMSYLPEDYGGSPETVTIQEALRPELDLIWRARDELLLQLSPKTATWGLAYWEEAFGLPVDEGKDLEQRRSLVLAKLRGRATTTPALVKSLAEGILGVEIEVGEIFPEDRVELRLDAPNRLPPGLDDLKVLLDKIMPAHLTWDYLITITPTIHVGGYFTSYNVTTLPVAMESEEI